MPEETKVESSMDYAQAVELIRQFSHELDARLTAEGAKASQEWKEMASRKSPYKEAFLTVHEMRAESTDLSPKAFAERLVRELDGCPAAQFFAHGIGNVIDSDEALGRDGYGGHGYVFDYKKARMSNADEAYDVTIFDQRGREQEAPYAWRFLQGNMGQRQYIALKMNTQGATSANKLIRDSRNGFAVVGILIDPSVSSQLLSPKALSILQHPMQNQEIWVRILATFAERHIPAYWSELREMQSRYKTHHS